MVPLIRAYKCRLAQIAEFVQAKDIQKVGNTREQLFPCVEVY